MLSLNEGATERLEVFQAGNEATQRAVFAVLDVGVAEFAQSHSLEWGWEVVVGEAVGGTDCIAAIATVVSDKINPV